MAPARPSSGIAISASTFRHWKWGSYLLSASTGSCAAPSSTLTAGAHTAVLPQQLLTAQELQVAIAVGEGKTNKEAAAALFLSPKTIEFHLDHIYRKLGIHTRTQLARKILTGPQTMA